VLIICEIPQGALVAAGSAGLSWLGVGAVGVALLLAESVGLIEGVSVGAGTGIVTGAGFAGVAGAGITEGADGAC
jgi:hypothetical protein